MCFSNFNPRKAGQDPPYGRGGFAVGRVLTRRLDCLERRIVTARFDVARWHRNQRTEPGSLVWLLKSESDPVRSCEPARSGRLPGKIRRCGPSGDSARGDLACAQGFQVCAQGKKCRAPTAKVRTPTDFIERPAVLVGPRTKKPRAQGVLVRGWSKKHRVSSRGGRRAGRSDRNGGQFGWNARLFALRTKPFRWRSGLFRSRAGLRPLRASPGPLRARVGGLRSEAGGMKQGAEWTLSRAAHGGAVPRGFVTPWQLSIRCRLVRRENKARLLAAWV